MPNPFIKENTVSNEDSAAFSDELAQSTQKKEEHYLKGYTSDDPTLVENNKLQDDAEKVVDASLDNIEQVLSGEVTIESIDENPFTPKASPSIEEPLPLKEESPTNPFVGVVSQADENARVEAQEGSEQNPFFNVAAGETPEKVDVDGDNTPDLTTTVDSLESIIEDLEEVMSENQPNARSTEFLVDVRLEDDGKALLDQDIDAVIVKEPVMLESLESIKLCDERSVKSIITILRNKVDELANQ